MTRIIVDSTCDLSVEECEKLGITMLSLHVRFGNKEFLDKRTITNEQFYKMLVTENESPKTALVSAGEFLDTYEQFPYDDLIVITISKNLSGTYQAALTAKELSGRDNIYVIETGSASLGSALIVDKAVAIKDEQPADETAEILKAYVSRVRIVGIIDTLKYLVKGGRLSPLQGSVGGLLGIKPLLLIKDGEIENIAKARGSQAAFDKLEDILKTKFKPDRREEFVFAHANNESGANLIHKIMGSPKKSRFMTIGSVVGTHTGPGVVCVAFFEHPLIGTVLR